MTELTPQKAKEILDARRFELVDGIRDAGGHKVMAATYPPHELERILGREWKQTLAGYLHGEKEAGSGFKYPIVNLDGLREFIKGPARPKG